MMKSVPVALASMLLAGCATMSFAPPPVETRTKVARHVAGLCTPERATHDSAEIVINPNLIGATDLIDNFVLAYRCAEQELANGRQYFQVPAFFAAVAGLVGPSFGLSADGVLAAGASASVLNAGNSYYAPREKAAVLNSALKAVLCVKTESVGVSFFRTSDDPPKAARAREGLEYLQQAARVLELESAELAGRQARSEDVRGLIAANLNQRRQINDAMIRQLLLVATGAPNGTVFADAELQYYEMVSASLFSIESALSERLRDMGSTNMEDIFAKLKELAAKSTAADKKLADRKDALGTSFNMLSAGDQQDIVTLENQALQPKLQACVLQARN